MDNIAKCTSEASPDELAAFVARLGDATRRRIAHGIEQVEKKMEGSDADLMAVFNKFDSDRSGQIDAQELGDAMRLLGMNPTLEDVQNAIASVDDNNNGLLDFEEFKQLMRGKLRDWLNVDQIKDLIDAFAALDSQGSGRINADQLKQVMCAPGEDLSSEDLKEIMRAGQADKDGMIDYKALVPTYFFGGSGAAMTGAWDSVSGSVSSGYSQATSSLPSRGELVEGGSSAFAGALGSLSSGYASATAALSSSGGVGSMPQITVYYWGPHESTGMNMYGRSIAIYLTLDQAGCPYEMKPPDQMPSGFAALGKEDGGAYAPPVVEIDGTCMAQAPMILSVLGEMLNLGGKTLAEKMQVRQALGDVNDMVSIGDKLKEDEELRKKWFGYLEQQLSRNTRWMAGTAEPTIADFHGVFLFAALDQKKVDYSAYPKVNKWSADIKAYPVVAKMFASCVNGRTMMPG